MFGKKKKDNCCNSELDAMLKKAQADHSSKPCCDTSTCCVEAQDPKDSTACCSSKAPDKQRCC